MIQMWQVQSEDQQILCLHHMQDIVDQISRLPSDENQVEISVKSELGSLETVILLLFCFTRTLETVITRIRSILAGVFIKRLSEVFEQHLSPTLGLQNMKAKKPTTFPISTSYIK